MQISVTQTDILTGLIEHAPCPVKSAVMRSTGWNENDFSVGPTHVIYWEPLKRYLLSKPAQRFVSRFDSEREVGPFEFELEM